MFRFYVYWAPYLAYMLLILGLASARIPTTFISKTGFFSIICLLVTVLIFCGHGYLASKASTRSMQKDAKLALFISTSFFVLLVLVTEIFLPPVDCQYCATQNAIQNQLTRRNRTSSKEFRGITENKRYNELGWVDQNIQYVEDKQIVFIGDSFLEVRSSKNIAEITQQLLALNGSNLDVINLSKDDVGVDYYKYLFHEFALDLNPSHLYVFIYEANDINQAYTYEAYQPRSFNISDDALAFIDEDKTISSHTKDILRDLHKKNAVFTSKTDLFRHLENLGLSQNQIYLIYLASYAYMCNPSPEYFPKISDRITRIIKNFQAYRSSNAGNSRPSWTSFYSEYIEIFNLPEQERLEAIARLVSQEYLLLDDYLSTLTLLESQDEQFRELLIEQEDMNYYLLPAIEQGLLGTIISSDYAFDAGIVGSATGEYLKLFDEMQKLAEGRGVDFTIVLIPEASYGDEDFQRFWSPMIDYQEYFLINHNIYLSLKQSLLEKGISVIDLGDYPKEFQNGYWKFDGHWNEKGNQQVAEIILSSILAGRD